MEQFFEVFDKVFAQNGLLEYATEQSKQTYASLCNHILEVNKVHNLTAIRDVPGVITKHFADSLTISPYIAQNATLIDVGTGGGFPTLPLAVSRPDLKITAIDSTAKKIAHVQSTAHLFGLDNVTALTGRAEELAQTKMRESFDYAAARAVSELRILCEITLPFVKVGGYLIAMKGASGKKELQDAKNAIQKLGGALESEKHLALIDENCNSEERYLFMIKKVAHTPQNFPRQYSQILKKPL